GERQPNAYQAAITELLINAGAEPQYVALLEPGTVTAVDTVEGPTVLAIAAMVGKTRLIDNTTIG
ncbi:MAG: pantoate--beta-alanine ligase, partial [Planctomycetota bacterium]